MNSRYRDNLKWIAPLIILVLVATGCSGAATAPTQTPIPPSPPSESAVTPTSVPAPSPEPAVTPTPVPDSAQETEASDEDDLDHEVDEYVLFEDDFKDTASGWPDTLVFDNYYIGYHEPEWYHVEVHAQNDDALTVLPEQSFDDFSVEAEAFVEEPLSAPEGDFRYGLVTRRSGKQFYAFTISPRTQTWYVLKSSPSGLEVLEEGSNDSIQNETEVAMLRVDAVGPTQTFHINGQPVSQISDPDYESGELGFFVEAFDSPKVHIHYDSLTIGEAPEEVPAFEFAQSNSTETATTLAQTTPEPLCRVVTGNLNLRSGPGTVYTPIDVLPNGTGLEPLARSPDALWIQVRELENDQVGWVAAAFAYVSCEVSVPDLPMGEMPAPSASSAP